MMQLVGEPKGLVIEFSLKDHNNRKRKWIILSDVRVIN